MIANALVATTAVFISLVFWLLQTCTFLIPFRNVLLNDYGTVIAICGVLLFVNLFAGFYSLSRALFLKNTGDKLAHLEKQLRSGATISHELSRRLNEGDL
jgi:uncharacterized membrane protein